MNALGRHLLAEFTGCDRDRLADLEFIRERMLAAAEACGATVVTHSFHHFAPLGVSGVVIISESHLAIHTWPEYGFAAVDLFTCGSTVEPDRGVAVLQEAFRSAPPRLRLLARGELPLV